jgi:hypothetical protein
MPSVSAPYIPLVRVQPQGLYVYFCNELGLHPNSGVVDRLSKVCLLCGAGAVGVDTPATADAVEQINESIAAAASDGAAAPVAASLLELSPTEELQKLTSPPIDQNADLCGSTPHQNNNSLSSSSSLCEGSTDTILNLAANFVGCEGLRPLLQTIRVVHFFTTVDLSGHGMDSDGVAEVVKYLDGVHSLRSLILNRNPRITQAGGRHLKLFVASNVNVGEIHIDHTSITLALKNVIHGLCAANRALRKNPVLYEDKALWQHRRRHSVGMPGSSPQPTPMKHDKHASVSPLASSRGGVDCATGGGGSASRQESAIGGNAMTYLHHQTDQQQRHPPSVILPPFYGAPFLPALLHADGVISSAGSRVSPPATPVRPTDMSALSNEDVPRRAGGEAAMSVSPAAADPLEGPLEAIDYVFASALPNHLGTAGHHHSTSNTTIVPRVSPPDEFPALQLLRDAMYDLQ